MANKCQHRGCDHDARFGRFNGTKFEDPPIYCEVHRTKDTIDFTSVRCIVCNINRPMYNFQGSEKATHCEKDRLKGMIHLLQPQCHQFLCSYVPINLSEVDRHPYCKYHYGITNFQYFSDTC